MKKKLLAFIKKETIFTVSILLALISTAVVHKVSHLPDAIDQNTLMLLFCLMAVMAGYKELGLFRSVGASLLSHTKNTRQLACILIFLPFFFSMLITNDVALITFVPFAVIVLRLAGEERLLVWIVTLQTIAANLGSMLTPMGNPQNLYLFSLSKMSLPRFLRLLAPYAGTACICLLIACLFVKKTRLDHLALPDLRRLDILPCVLYGILFFLCLLCVADILPILPVFVIIVFYLLFLDRKIFLQVDYTLLGTFIGFFVFIGNMGEIPWFCSFIEKIVSGHEALVAVLSSQIISNVPTALLLSGFTDNVKALIIGTNLGGLGTLIASMASLISYKQIAREYPGERGRYILLFTAANLCMLLVLFLVYIWVHL